LDGQFYKQKRTSKIRAEKKCKYAHVNANWVLHAEAVDDGPLPQSTIRQSQELSLAKNYQA